MNAPVKNMLKHLSGKEREREKKKLNKEPTGPMKNKEPFDPLSDKKNQVIRGSVFMQLATCKLLDNFTVLKKI